MLLPRVKSLGGERWSRQNCSNASTRRKAQLQLVWMPITTPGGHVHNAEVKIERLEHSIRATPFPCSSCWTHSWSWWPTQQILGRDEDDRDHH
jgi:hypothetical protein